MPIVFDKTDVKASQGDYSKKSADSTDSLIDEKKYVVSLQVQSVMRKRRASPKVILKASITTVLAFSFGFLVLYTFLLKYFPHPVPYHKGRVKLVPKYGGSAHFMVSRQSYYSVKWNISEILGKTPGNICRGGIEFLILIVSAPENVKNRQVIRETWCNPVAYGHSKNSWQCLFLIGQSESVDIQNSLSEEFKSFKDILLGSYMDSYRNLTLKVMQALHWSNTNCPAKFTLKTDDDCFVQTHNLHELVTHHQDASGLFMGHVHSDISQLHVIRNKDSRWHVLREDYEQDLYPPYISGVGYLLSYDVVQKLVNISQYIKIIPNEDAFIGILAQAVNISPSSSARFQLTSSGWSLCNYMYLVVFHRVEVHRQKDVFDKTLQALKTCKNPLKLTWN